jgi:hypothetical protein
MFSTISSVTWCLTRDRVDWAAKKFLLHALQEEEKLSWKDPWLQSIDLEYHNVDLERGLYYELVRQGAARRVVSEEDIKTSIFSPPEDHACLFSRSRPWPVSTTRFPRSSGTRLFSQTDRYHAACLAGSGNADARLDALNHAARNGKDFGEFIRAVGEIG